MSSSSSVFLDIARWVFSLRHNCQLGKGKGLCKIDFAQSKYILAKPPMKYTVLFGWEDRNGLVPVYFKGQMSSDFLQDLVCT
jgi:hypothetical protein